LTVNDPDFLNEANLVVFAGANLALVLWFALDWMRREP
jgi:hypothetical protein